LQTDLFLKRNKYLQNDTIEATMLFAYHHGFFSLCIVLPEILVSKGFWRLKTQIEIIYPAFSKQLFQRLEVFSQRSVA